MFSQNSVLGNSVLGNSVLGDSVLGDSVLGDSVLGNPVLGNFYILFKFYSDSIQMCRKDILKH